MSVSLKDQVYSVNPIPTTLHKNKKMKTPYTRKKLAQDFTNLGIEKGDTLFIHSSFKSLGPVDGAGTVISALEAAVGQDGLILMPTFSLLPSREERVAAWDGLI